MTDPDLARFVDAQARVFDRVVEELQQGSKQSHWMWFVFPQLAGLGMSPTSRHYAIADLDQARRYLADPLLGERLRRVVGIMLRHRGKTAFQILGSPDDFKLRSCLTLFGEAATDPVDADLFAEALDAFFGGEADRRTLDLLAGR